MAQCFDRPNFKRDSNDNPIKWKSVHDEFYVDNKQMPVAVKIQTAVIEGFTRYGIVIQYSDRFLAFSVHDLPKLLNALNTQLQFAESMKPNRDDG